MNRQWIGFLAVLLALSGCWSARPWHRSTARLLWATYEDVDGNRLIGPPDTLTLTFSRDVAFPPGATAAACLVLQGGSTDTLACSSLSAGSTPREVIVNLCPFVSMQPTGVFGVDPGATGIDMLTNQAIITYGKKGKRVPARGYPIDVEGELASRVTDAVYDDTNLNLLIDAGDVIRVDFFPPVDVDASATPDGAFQLPVAGDTFGAGAALDSPGGTNLTSIEILLGTSPVLQPNGLFDPGNLTPGAPSGIDVAGTPEITQTIGGAAVDTLSPVGADIR